MTNLTAEALARLREQHQPRKPHGDLDYEPSPNRFCTADDDWWPCLTVQLLDTMDAVRAEAQAERALLRAEIVSLLDAIKPWCPSCGHTPPPMKHGPDCRWAVAAGIAATEPALEGAE